jgi:hypothetical protein
VSARQKLEGLAVANSKGFNAVNRIPIKPPFGQNPKGYIVHNSVWCVRSVINIDKQLKNIRLG